MQTGALQTFSESRTNNSWRVLKPNNILLFQGFRLSCPALQADHLMGFHKTLTVEISIDFVSTGKTCSYVRQSQANKLGFARSARRANDNFQPLNPRPCLPVTIIPCKTDALCTRVSVRCARTRGFWTTIDALVELLPEDLIGNNNKPHERAAAGVSHATSCSPHALTRRISKIGVEVVGTTILYGELM